MKHTCTFLALSLLIASLHAADQRVIKCDIDPTGKGVDANQFAQFYMSLFKKHFHVDRLPYNDPNMSDILFVRIADRGTSLDVIRIASIKSFIDAVKKEWEQWSAPGGLVNRVARKYVALVPDDAENVYDERLRHIKQAISANYSGQTVRYNRSAYCHIMVYPPSIQQTVELISRFPQQGGCTREQFYVSVKRNLKKDGHEGSYIISTDFRAIGSFNADVTAVMDDYTGWMPIEVQPEAASAYVQISATENNERSNL